MAKHETDDIQSGQLGQVLKTVSGPSSQLHGNKKKKIQMNQKRQKRKTPGGKESVKGSAEMHLQSDNDPHWELFFPFLSALLEFALAMKPR